MVNLTWPFYLSGVAKTDFDGSGLRATIPFGLKQVSMASMRRRSAKLYT
jgi:hypothetical protein